MHEGTGQTRYDGTEVYLPRVNELLPGDILLTFNAEAESIKDAKLSRVIRRAAGGSFSHALICGTPPMFVEAIGSGVSSLSLARCFAHDIGNVRLLRWPNREVALNAARLAQDEIGRDYSFARAIASVFPTRLLERIDDHGTFCSALVAQAYTLAGATAFLATTVDMTTPATLEAMQGLQDVTATAFRRALAPNNIGTMSALDGERAPTPSAKQTRISAACAKELWPTAEGIAKAFPELPAYPVPSFYGLLRFVTRTLESVHLVPGNRRADLTGQIATLDRALAAFVARGDMRSLLEEVEGQDGATISRNIRESFQPSADIDLEAMSAYLAAGEKALQTRLAALAEWERWPTGRSEALDAYLAIDREAIKTMTLRNIALREILERLGAA